MKKIGIIVVAAPPWVPMPGISWSRNIRKKYALAILVNYSSKLSGKKFSIVYFDVRIALEQNCLSRSFGPMTWLIWNFLRSLTPSAKDDLSDVIDSLA